MARRNKPLAPLLNSVFDAYHRAEFLSSDPLEFVHQYQDPWDQEAVALIAALLAYGNVKQIRASIRAALDRIASCSESPQAFVRALGTARGQPHVLDGWVHRFTRGPELARLLTRLAQSWRTHGSLGREFLSGMHSKDPTIEGALDRLIRVWRAEMGASYLLTAPEDGSCCKRWCMFLRWMGRKDALDPGLWTAGSPLLAGSKLPGAQAVEARHLLIPLDTHTGRISQSLGLTERRTLGWKAVREVTAALALYDPQDPARYDFALARLGILR